MARRSWLVRWGERIGRWTAALAGFIAAVLAWCWRFLKTTWRRRGSSWGGARLAVVAALAGTGIGYVIGGDRYQLLTITVLELPKPVTPPPAGMRWVQVLTTGYCPCAICCEEYAAAGRTSTGRDVRVHPFGIASDHRQVPPGTVLDVPGYGRAIVDDTGGAMRQDARQGIVHLDLRFVEHREARRWGRRRMWIAMPR
jgi:3D (Asp-Asp-Asp) domain-containing protein